MKTQKIKINNIPAIIWGEPSDKVYLFVHGKMASKECAEYFAKVAQQKGYQTISFDLPQHGERAEENERCDIWNGMRDLAVIGEYVSAQWKEVCLFACSLGAYFSLNAYNTYHFRKCLFQSPILDMEYLIKQMMLWFDVSEEQLERELEVDTPIDVLSWAYYRYVLEHPVEKWDIPTHILYAGQDDLQSLQVINDFVAKHNCRLDISENSKHPFMEEADAEIVNQWLLENI